MKNGTEHDMTQGAVAVPLIGFTIPLVPVSYTHLDVYKRQGYMNMVLSVR